MYYLYLFYCNCCLYYRNYYYYYYCNTIQGSSGCPILNESNFQVIGMNIGIDGQNYTHNLGINIKYLIKEFLNFYLNK